MAKKTEQQLSAAYHIAHQCENIDSLVCSVVVSDLLKYLEKYKSETQELFQILEKMSEDTLMFERCLYNVGPEDFEQFSQPKNISDNNVDKTVKINQEEFSAVAPTQLFKGKYTIISIIMYEKTSRSVVDSIIQNLGEPAQESRSGIHTVKEGSSVKVILSSPNIIIEDNAETGVWQGDHLVFSFAVCLPEQYEKSQLLFTASVYINDVIATKLKFVVKCASYSQQKISVSRADILSAFISYASQDRNRVAAIIHGLKKGPP